MVDAETTSSGIPPAPRTRLTAQERRRSIVDAARREFARVGFHGAATSRIAAHAGCSEPMLYKHFSGKHALFLAALRDSVTRFQTWFDSTIDESLDVREQARGFVVAQMRDPEFHQLLQLRMLAASLADDEDVRATLVELDRATRNRIRSVVERGKQDGGIAADVDPDYVSWTWLGLMLASCYREASEPGTFGEMSRLAETFIESLAPPA
jgi:AcrR family transcriptional regulator